MKRYVLYHGNCYDGFGAAFAAWKMYGDEPNTTYLPVTHGQEPPEMEDGSEVHILDFSYRKAVLLALAQRMWHVVVLDHHKTAEEELCDLARAWRPDMHVLFDMERSGAVMAWEFYHGRQPVPRLLLYVQDRDLWRFALPKSEEVSSALRSHPFNFGVWEGLKVADLKRDGTSILRHTKQTVQMICEQARWSEIAGQRCVVVNSTAYWSEVGHRLLEEHPEAPFAASYFDTKHGTRAWSLRSRGDFDVSALAKSLGGGGHKAAAGFTESRTTVGEGA